MNICDIPVEQLLVHKPPMRLIDRAVSATEHDIECEVEIRPDNIFWTNSGVKKAVNGGVPAYVAVEFMAQSIGVFDGWNQHRHNHPPRIGYLVGTRQLKLNCDTFSTGQILRIKASLIWDGVNLLQFRCLTTDKTSNEELASATMNVFSPERDNSEGTL